MIVDLVRNDLGRVCATGIGHRARRCAPSSSTPAWSTSSPPCAASCADGAGWPELLAGHLPARLGHRRAQVQRPADHRRAGDRARAARTAAASAGSTPTAAPASWPSASAPSGSTATPTAARAPLRHRRRHHLGLRPRAASGAETELKAVPAARGSVGSVRRRAEGQLTMKIWVDGGLQDADDARVSVFDHGLTVGDGVFETVKAVARPALRAHPAPRPADPLRPRPRPARARPRRGAPRLRRRARRQPDAARPAAHHLHRRALARSAPTAATHGPTLVVALGEADPPPRHHRRRHRALDAQRARRADRPEDHLVRRERRRPRPRPANRAPPRRCSPTPSGSSARAPAPTSSSSSTASCTPRRSPPAASPASPARWSSSGPAPRRPTCRWTRWSEAEEIFLTSTLRDVQAVHRVDGRELPGAPGPVTAKAMRSSTSAPGPTSTRELEPP